MARKGIRRQGATVRATIGPSDFFRSSRRASMDNDPTGDDMGIVHYLDDFITLAPGNSPVCSKNMETMAVVCAEAGLPIEPSKTVGPTTKITFLGMELDSLEGEIRLPEDKLRALKDLLQKWRAKTACRKRELLSLLGLLNHACKAVRAGRSFLYVGLSVYQPKQRD